MHFYLSLSALGWLLHFNRSGARSVTSIRMQPLQSQRAPRVGRLAEQPEGRLAEPPEGQLVEPPVGLRGEPLAEQREPLGGTNGNGTNGNGTNGYGTMGTEPTAMEPMGTEPTAMERMATGRMDPAIDRPTFTVPAATSVAAGTSGGRNAMLKSPGRKQLHTAGCEIRAKTATLRAAFFSLNIQRSADHLLLLRRRNYERALRHPTERMATARNERFLPEAVE